MDKVEKIKTEYCLYEHEEPESIDSVYESIFGYIDVANEKKSSFEKERKDNGKRIRVSSLFGNAAKKVGFLEPEVYERDNEFIDLQERILDGYVYQLTMTIREIEEDNYHDISRLMGFVTKKYLANYASVEEERKISELKAAGVERKRRLSDDDSLFVEVFFNETFNNIVNGCVAVKSKVADRPE